AVHAGRAVQGLGLGLHLGEGLGRLPAFLRVEVLPVEEHEGIDEGRDPADALVGLEHRRLGARHDVVPVEVGRRERLVVEERVDRLIPAGLPEAPLLDVGAGVEAVHAARAAGHLDDELLAALDLRQDLVLDLHAGQRLELGDVRDQLVDPGVLVVEEEPLLALDALPGDPLGAGRRPHEGPGGRAGRRCGAELEHRAAREGRARGVRRDGCRHADLLVSRARVRGGPSVRDLPPTPGPLLPPTGGRGVGGRLIHSLAQLSVRLSSSWNSFWAWAAAWAAGMPSIARWMATPMMSRYSVTATISGRPWRPILSDAW